MSDRLTSLLAERPWLLADGATGSNLFERGLQSGDAPELWNADHPDRVAQLQREFSLTYLFISHSMPIVRYLSTRIAVMHGGKILELNSTEQITENPQHRYTKALLTATPEIRV